LANLFKSSPLKPLGQMNWNLVGSIYGMSSTELQISCVFAFFTQWKRVKTHVLSDQSVHLRIHIAV
jgi:hypothetical protein